MLGSRRAGAAIQLRLATYTARIASASTACLDRLAYLCESFVTEVQADADVELCLTMDGGVASGLSAWDGATLLRHASTVEQLVSAVEWWLCNEAVRRSTELLHIHAGAAVKDGAAVLFPAVSGAGKSTLTLGLLARGFQLLGDDLAFIDPHTRLVQPFWRSFHLDSDSILLLRRLGVLCHAQNIRQRVFPPSTFGLGVPPAPAPLRVLIFPQREGLSPGELTPLSQAEAAMALVPLSAALRRGDRSSLLALHRLLEDCACYRLGTADLRRAVDTVDQLMGRVGQVMG